MFLFLFHRLLLIVLNKSKNIEEMSATETDEPKIDLRIEQNRIDTFKDWPVSFIDTQISEFDLL